MSPFFPEKMLCINTTKQIDCCTIDKNCLSQSSIALMACVHIYLHIPRGGCSCMCGLRDITYMHALLIHSAVSCYVSLSRWVHAGVQGYSARLTITIRPLPTFLMSFLA